MRLLVTGDDGCPGETLTRALTSVGHHVDRARQASDLLTSHSYCHAVIVDIRYPDLPWLQMLRALRKVSSIPVVILATDDSEQSIVRGLRCGADEYLVKPVRIGELAARLEALARRAAAAPWSSGDSSVLTGDVRIDLVARQVDVSGRPIRLTRTEFELLRVLVEQSGSTVSRKELTDRVWGNTPIAASRRLDAHIGRLRMKLERPDVISTLRGRGYRWELGAAPTSGASLAQSF